MLDYLYKSGLFCLVPMNPDNRGSTVVTAVGITNSGRSSEIQVLLGGGFP